MLGVLMLETRFPRLPGDIGHPETFDFPVRRRVVRGAVPRRVVGPGDATLLAPFIEAGLALVAEGADAITTSCGFLVRFQSAFQAALPVRVWTSSLLLVPELDAGLPNGKRVGIVTVDAEAIDADLLRAAGAATDTPIEGLAPGCAFQRCLLDDEPALDAPAACAETVAAAQRLVARHPEVGALVLECTNMPPHADAVRQASGLPVHDLTTLLRLRYPRCAAPAAATS